MSDKAQTIVAVVVSAAITLGICGYGVFGQAIFSDSGQAQSVQHPQS